MAMRRCNGITMVGWIWLVIAAGMIKVALAQPQANDVSITVLAFPDDVTTDPATGQTSVVGHICSISSGFAICTITMEDGATVITQPLSRPFNQGQVTPIGPGTISSLPLPPSIPLTEPTIGPAPTGSPTSNGAPVTNTNTNTNTIRPTPTPTGSLATTTTTTNSTSTGQSEGANNNGASRPLLSRGFSEYTLVMVGALVGAAVAM